MLKNHNHLLDHYGPDFGLYMDAIGQDFKDNRFALGHAARYAATLVELKRVLAPGMNVLEIGNSGVLHRYVDLEVGRWDRLKLSNEAQPRLEKGELPWGVARDRRVPSDLMHANLEQHSLEMVPNRYDVVICAETIQRLDVDPMSAMSEINRLAFPNAVLLLTTPNATAARVVMKVVRGYHPSFFMQYTRDRNPLRHNFEYTPQLAERLVTAAGFELEKRYTVDVYEDPVPEGLKLLTDLKAPTAERGDAIFIVARKRGDVTDRYPAGLYC